MATQSQPQSDSNRKGKERAPSSQPKPPAKKTKKRKQPDEPRTFTEEEVAKMDKQTEDKILEMLLHVHEKSTRAHPFDPQKDGVEWWIKRCGGTRSLRTQILHSPRPSYAPTQEDNDDEGVVGDDGDVCALCCTKSNPEKMSMCDKCELQYCTDCIDTHTCDNVTFLWFCNCVMLCTQVAYSQCVLS